jgi:hypothetical protein
MALIIVLRGLPDIRLSQPGAFATELISAFN